VEERERREKERNDKRYCASAYCWTLLFSFANWIIAQLCNVHNNCLLIFTTIVVETKDEYNGEMGRGEHTK